MQLAVIWRRQHNMMRGYIAGGMRTLITSHCGRFIFNMANMAEKRGCGQNVRQAMAYPVAYPTALPVVRFLKT